MISRRSFVGQAAGLGLAVAGGKSLWAAMPGSDADPTMTIYMSPTCGCCANWVEHMREAGFTVEVQDRNDMAAVKAEHGVPDQLMSCHTAVVEGYVVEGHVPADLVRRLLAERPDADVLAVPGMPIGSPGMEQDGRAVPYEVILYDRERGPSLYASR